MEWFQQEYWIHERAYWGDKVAHQYLDPYGSDVDCGDHSEREDWSHPGRIHKMLTVDQAKAMRPEIVLCSLFHNESGYYRMSQELGAKFGLQVGNLMTPNHFEWAHFAMLSCTKPDGRYPTIPYVMYHQEFSLKDFYFEYPPLNMDASTWVHGVGGTQWFSLFGQLAHEVPELTWRTYGHKEEHPYWSGSISPTFKVAWSMRAARVGIHFKTHGDGYGHVIHNLFACGKPVVGTATYYQDQIAGPLFVDGVTSFDVQRRSHEDIAQVVKKLALDDDFHQKVSEASHRRFQEVVNFDEDAEKVRKLVEGIL